MTGFVWRAGVRCQWCSGPRDHERDDRYCSDRCRGAATTPTTPTTATTPTTPTTH